MLYSPAPVLRVWIINKTKNINYWEYESKWRTDSLFKVGSYRKWSFSANMRFTRDKYFCQKVQLATPTKFITTIDFGGAVMQYPLSSVKTIITTLPPCVTTMIIKLPPVSKRRKGIINVYILQNKRHLQYKNATYLASSLVYSQETRVCTLYCNCTVVTHHIGS